MRAFHIIVSTVILSIASFSVSADYTVDKGSIRLKRHQDIVITISKNPVEHIEEVCLALTMGQILRQSGKKVNVTVFLRNDGVFLADDDHVIGSCAVPDPNDPTSSITITLEQNLIAFIDGNDNNLVNCPLCWGARVLDGWIQNPIPDYGVLANEAVVPVLLGADKVIDF